MSAQTPLRSVSRPELRRALEAGGHRFTTQREAVYQALSARTNHPTADDVFTTVRERVPDISLATVYKALEAFVSCRVARKLTLGPGPARYDSRIDEHEHVRCLACGQVQDIEPAEPGPWLVKLGRRTEYDVVGYRLELVGYCPECVT